jgi:NADP-dependent aldehyde dehydrogenase
MKLEGLSIIGAGRGTRTDQWFRGIDPATGVQLDGEFHRASDAEVDAAVALAEQAFASYGWSSGKVRGALLCAIADGLEASRDAIVARAESESGLPVPRLKSEVYRASGQMRLFAEMIEEGSWVDARIDHAEPERKPLAKPDVRSMLRPLGPVAIFGASNFPVAFSVAGGDTASALAAGCPVVVKAHPSHPGTSEIVGCIIRDAVKAQGLHEGVFSLLLDDGYEVGLALVRHPKIRAVGFTGSRRGGVALMAEASKRSEPVPVYAEMGSINPVFVLPGALRERGESIAKGLQFSVTLGVGQFCTNPGLSILERGPEAESFLAKLSELVSSSEPAVMLNHGICSAYHTGAKRFAETEGVTQLAGVRVEGGDGALAGASLFSTGVKTFLENESLMDEVFGPSTLVVQSEKGDDLLAIARSLEGQLTATVHGTDEDLAAHRDLVAILETKVGRVVFNSFPTGVEVCHAMVHGGPFPATSDGRTTSVGTRAIERFARPVAWQDAPESMMPDELKDENPLGILRLVDGRRE